MTRINIGCGASPTPGWTNYDNSFSIRLARRPMLTRVMRMLGLLRPAQRDYIEVCRTQNVNWANATKEIPQPDRSVTVLYTSHMLEHLDREEARSFLSEALRALDVDGVIRIAVPDLALLVDEYSTTSDADAFMARSYLSFSNPTSLRGKLNLLTVGDRGHKWMYDGASLCKLVEEVGFADAVIQPAGETRIADPGDLDLFERSDESVYVEAVRPR